MSGLVGQGRALRQALQLQGGLKLGKSGALGFLALPLQQAMLLILQLLDPRPLDLRLALSERHRL